MVKYHMPLMTYFLDFRSTLEARLEMTLAELTELQKTLGSLRESEGAFNNGVDHRKSIVENCRHMIKEVSKI